MIHALTYCHEKKELQELIQLQKDVIPYVSEEEWKQLSFLEAGQIMEWLEQKELLDVCTLEMSDENTVKTAEEIRSLYSDTYMLVIANEGMSPMMYLKPTVRPTSLLLKPFREEEAKKTIRDFLEAFCKTREQDDRKNAFVVERKEGNTYIPFDKIYYFESREKKIFVRMLGEEIGFYTTIDQLTETLPDSFVRCHRSYIINRDKVTEIRYGLNEVELEQGMILPISRSYKKELKRLERGDGE